MEMLLLYLAAAVGVFVLSGLKVIDQYERGIVLTLGRFTGTRQPGLWWCRSSSV